MSASLVGSEMCIRDRGPRAGEGNSPGSPHQHSRAAAVPSWAGWREPECCLLYTSDAADDM
eukprot:454824-Alexandrium_andersonii.AAC.1